MIFDEVHEDADRKIAEAIDEEIDENADISE